jgi:hypothetical protein
MESMLLMFGILMLGVEVSMINHYTEGVIAPPVDLGASLPKW